MAQATSKKSGDKTKSAGELRERAEEEAIRRALLLKERTVVERLVAEHTTAPQFGLLGAPRVNVLELNLALDGAGKPE